MSVEHEDPAAAELVRTAIEERLFALDNVELTTVGIDVGSSTSHLLFSRLRLRRPRAALSSRFEVVERETLWRSPILLTPYRDDLTIDAERLAGFVDEGYRTAGLARDAVDAGAVILTGEALKRRNARAIAELVAQDAGRFVCATAGHHLESVLGAHGSGAVALSRRRGKTLLNVDIGGGTAKLALVREGAIVATCAIAVGARGVVTDDAARIVRLDDPARAIGAALGLDLRLGAGLDAEDRRRLAVRMAELLVAAIARHEPDGLGAELLLTEGWDEDARGTAVDALTFSGGVSEYLYGREERSFGDLGPDLAHELSHALARASSVEVWDPGHGIRATVSGAASFSVQVSGNTILVRDPDLLPLRNVPALVCGFRLDGAGVEPEAVAGVVRAALARHDVADGESPVALSFAWEGLASYPRLRALADGIAAALPRTLRERVPLVLVVDGDVGMTLGRIVADELVPGSRLVALDGIALQEFDYVDVGQVIPVSEVVPVVVKSLLF